MISSEVQRTLVKSPPELWAELSDPAALARHLGELGEIRITRTEPEKLVEWEAEGTKGTVAIKPSGWGTKVTLSVSRELPVPEPSEPGVTGEETEASEPAAELASAEQQATVGAESEPSSIDLKAASAEPSSTSALAGGLDAWASQEAEQAGQPMITAAERFAHDDPEPLLGTRLGSGHEAEDIEVDHVDPVDTGSGPPAETPEPTEPRRGFLARLFGRRRKRAEPLDVTPMIDDAPQVAPSPEPSISVQDTSETPGAPVPAWADEASPPVEVEAVADSEPVAFEPAPTESGDVLTGQSSSEPITEQAATEPVADLAAELQKAEEAASEEVTAVLSGMLDRLGAAHHRPFSRA
jgi:hypothetical protein